jgi:hypothetical protein
MRDYIQLIGHALQEQCPADAQSALIYCEVEDGTIGASIFFLSAADLLQFRFASEEVEDLVYALWEEGTEQVPAQSWRAVEYALVDGKLSLEFTYDEKFDEAEGHRDRRARVVARHFPGRVPDFSNSHG